MDQRPDMDQRRDVGQPTPAEDTAEWWDTAKRVRNWGRWGSADELGTLNLLTPRRVADAVTSVRSGRSFSLSLNLDSNGPQRGRTPFRANPLHFMSVDGGDGDDMSAHLGDLDLPGASAIAAASAASITRINDDYVVMPLQAGTQWDALAHAYYDGQLYNGFSSRTVTSFGAARCGIDTPARHGLVGRGVLLDVARARGVDLLPPGEPISPDELDSVCRRQGVDVGPGDILVVRTGWVEEFRRRQTDRIRSSGLSWRCARWLHDREVAAVAADNLAVESPGELKSIGLPLHLLCLRDMGMMLGELWDLETLAGDCQADGRYDFLLTAPPLRFTGGVGTPVNPIAVK